MAGSQSGKVDKERPDARRGWRGLPRNVWILGLTSFFTDVSSEMLINLLPLFLANVLGAGTAVIGLIEGLAESVASLLKVVSGCTGQWIPPARSLVC